MGLGLGLGSGFRVWGLGFGFGVGFGLGVGVRVWVRVRVRLVLQHHGEHRGIHVTVEAALAARTRRGVVLGDEEVAEVERARRAVLRAEALGVQREQAGGEALPHHAAAAQLVQRNVHGRVLPVERAPAVLRRVRLGLLEQRRALRFGQQPRHDLRQAEASRQRQRQAAGQSSLHPAGEPARRAAAMQSDESDCGSAPHREPVVLWPFDHADQVVSDSLQAMPATESVEHRPAHDSATATSPQRARHGHPKAQHEGQRELAAIVGRLTLVRRNQRRPVAHAARARAALAPQIRVGNIQRPRFFNNGQVVG